MWFDPSKTYDVVSLIIAVLAALPFAIGRFCLLYQEWEEAARPAREARVEAKRRYDDYLKAKGC